jgi:hypothetical protein
MSVELKAKCTTCQKVYTMSETQLNQAREQWCAISPCCGAVATVQWAAARPDDTKAAAP